MFYQYLCLSSNFLSSDAANGGSTVNDSATLEYMQKTFTAHYNGNRQPIGLYTHPVHLSVSHFYAVVFTFGL